jgi:hypothetical protein
MHSTAPTGSVSSLFASVRALGERFLTLVTLEGKHARLSLAWMLALALAVAALAITGWLALLACVVLALVQNDIVGWGWALAIAALLSFAGAGGPVFMMTWGINKRKRSDSIVLAEQQVAEARTAALVEYQAARAELRRRMSSLVFMGSVLIGAIALSYLVLGRGKPKPRVYPGSPGAWSQVVKTVQVLLPLLTALNSATKAARRPRANISETAK